jgi:hypothetical protein
MKLKKPYSQYLGKVIIYDERHKHLLLKSYKEVSGDDYVFFDTLCISYTGNTRLEVNTLGGFLRDSLDQEFIQLSEKEMHWIIKFALTGKEKLLASSL